MQITKRSPFTGKMNTIEVPITPAELLVGEAAYAQGAYIQNAFPTLAPEYREFLKTGITPEEWNRLFADDEEDNEETA